MKNVYPFEQNKLFGFSDEQGNIIIPAKYTHVYRPLIERDGSGAKLAGTYNNALWGVVCDNLHGLIDNLGNVKLDCCMESPFGHNLFGSRYERILIEKDGKYGFLDKEGNEVLACLYSIVHSNFRYGYGIVETDDKTDKVIDTQGNVLLQSYSVCDSQFDDKVYFACRTETNEECVVDLDGNEIIPQGQHYVFMHDGIIRLEQKGDGGYAFFSWEGKKISDFGQYSEVIINSDGCYRVKSNRNYGLLDKDMNVLVPCQYQSVERLLNNYFKVKDADGNWGVIYAGGEEILPCEYRSIDLWMPQNYAEGLVGVDLNGRCDKVVLVKAEDKERNTRFINLEGTELAPSGTRLKWVNGKILNLNDIKRGKNLDVDFFPAFLKESWKKPEGCTGLELVTNGMGAGALFDCDGNAIVSGERRMKFHTNDIRVVVGIQGKGATIYNEKGEKVAKIKCNEIGSFCSKNYITITDGGKYGLADWNGKVLVKCTYDYLTVDDRINLVCVKKDGLYGILDIKGKELLPCEYEKIVDTTFAEVDIVKLESAGKYAFATADGKQVSPLLYKEAVKGYNCPTASHVNGRWAMRSRLICVESEHLYELEKGALLQKEWSITRGKDVPLSMQYYLGDLTLAAKCVDGKKFKKGIIDKDKNVVLDFVYDAIGPWSVVENNALHALVKKGTKYGIINAQLKEVVPCEYDKKKPTDNLPASFASALNDVIAGKVKI